MGLEGSARGGCEWREPAFEAVPSAAQGRVSDECRAGRAWRHRGTIAALAASYQCFVAEVVGRRCASSAHRCAWSARMGMAAITSEKAGLESVPYAQSGDDAGRKGVTLANFGMLMGPWFGAPASAKPWRARMHVRVLMLVLRTRFWIGLSRAVSPNFAELHVAERFRVYSCLHVLGRRNAGWWLSSRGCLDGSNSSCG